MDNDQVFLIFDFDNTLVDSFKVILTIMEKIAKRDGFGPVTKAKINLFREKGTRQAAKELNLPLVRLPSIAREARQEFSKKIPSLKLHQGIEDLIISLKENNFNLGILTSNSKKNILTFLANNQIDSFDFVYAASNIFGKAKVLNDLKRKYKLNNSKTFYIGDEIRDIQAAKKVGFKAVAVTWGFNTKAALAKYQPDFLVEKPQEILEVLS